MKRSDTDFRQAFGRMAPQAIITRDELASLLATTAGAITQMAYRGELPQTAFPEKRRACWFVSDIRTWLDQAATQRRAGGAPEPEALPTKPRIGRPRHATDDEDA